MLVNQNNPNPGVGICGWEHGGGGGEQMDPSPGGPEAEGSVLRPSSATGSIGHPVSTFRT